MIARLFALIRMRNMISIIGLGTSAVVICGMALWYTHRAYYFNPLTFKKDDVTTSSWNYYKNPMELDIVYQPVEGPQTRYVTENRSEIDYVLAQLRGAKPTSYQPIVGRPSGQIWIQFRNPMNQDDYIDVLLRQNMKVALLAQQNPVTVSSGLRRFVEEKQASAKVT